MHYIDLNLDLFSEKTFYYKDVSLEAPKEPGIYFWYLMPKISYKKLTVQAFLEEISKLPEAFFNYSFASLGGKYFEGKLKGVISNWNFSNMQNADSKVNLNNIVLDEFKNLFFNGIYEMFLQMPPIRVGIANPDNLRNRLQNYSSKGCIEQIINKVGIKDFFSIDSCVLKTITINKKYKDEVKDYYSDLIYMYEKFYLNSYLPLGNSKRGN